MVVSDLDRTLIYSTSALALPPDGPVPALRCVETYEGRPLSFMTERAVALLAGLLEQGRFVPITTRTIAQYRRVRAPIADAEWAICANGGRLLRHGVEDRGFTAEVTARLADAGAPPAQVRAAFEALIAEHDLGPHVHGVRIAEDLFCYAVVDRAALPPEWLGRLSDLAVPLGWVVSLQGRKVYCVPAALTKSAAARRLADRLGADRILAAGDSLLDADLLEAADAAIRPAHGELADIGWHRPAVAVTAAVGVLAGEEIVRRLLAAAGAGGP